jgi:hypothetical protein
MAFSLFVEPMFYDMGETMHDRDGKDFAVAQRADGREEFDYWLLENEVLQV